MTILKIDSSISGDNSVSRVLTARIVEQLKAADPDAQLIERDLVLAPLGHLTLDVVQRPGGPRGIPVGRHDRDRRADV